MMGIFPNLPGRKVSKTVSDFYQALASGKLDIFVVRDDYIELVKRDF